jgi:CheY-like chemotaxis protein/predicted regulator of Ras-like GTPase activity (Roadblock/LC7/MglB family)
MTARQRILIVDDETKVAFFLQESLEALERNFEVVSVSSAEEALHRVNHKRFDLLVTDQRMPGMNGLELVQKMQEHHPDTQFILITAYGSEDILVQAQRLGAIGYFTKPFHIEDFVQTVLGALQEGVDGHASRGPLSEQRVDVLGHCLEELRREVGAQCVLAASAVGALIAQAGVLTGLDVERLLLLSADGFIASSAMSHYLGGHCSNNLTYYEGPHHDIYVANVHDDLFLLVVFDRRVQASRIGIVWLYARRAVEHLYRLTTLSPLDEITASEEIPSDYLRLESSPDLAEIESD